MGSFDYSEVKSLLNKYKGKYYSLLTPKQRDLLEEFINDLEDLDEISKEIVEYTQGIVPLEKITPNENDEVIFGPFKVKLTRADPNVPIGLDNFSEAYPRGRSAKTATNDIDNLKRKLERETKEFYRITYRMIKLAENLPGLKAFDSKNIRLIRNKLIEHPEEVQGVTYDTFAYSLNEGPVIKGLRRGDQTQFMDHSFKKSSEEILSKLKNSIQNALD